MTMPTPPAGGCQQLVQATWDFAFYPNRRWPTFAELDRWVDRRYDTQIDDLWEMPPGAAGASTPPGA